MAYTNYILWGDSVAAPMGVRESGAHMSAVGAVFPALRGAQDVRGFVSSEQILDYGIDYYADIFQAHDADLDAISALTGTGIAVRSAADTWVLRSVAVSSANGGIAIANGNGVAGDPILSLDSTLENIAVHGGSRGLLSLHTGGIIWTVIDLTAVGEGLTIAGGGNANYTFTFNHDLAALEALASTGIAVRSATDTWVQRVIAVGSGLSIADAGGVAGNPTISLGANLAAYATVTPSAFSLTLFDDAAASDWRTDLGLGSLATASSVTVAQISDASANGRSLISAADYSAMRTLLSLVVGTNVQAYDAELAALAGLTSAADKLPYFTGSGTAAVADFSSFARTFVDDADAATVRTTIGAQGLDATLTALAAFNTNGILTQTAADTFTGRTITGTTSQITLANGDGVSGNPTVSLPDAIIVGSAGGGTVSAQLRGEGTTSLQITRYSTDVTQPQFTFQKAGGTIASPANVATNYVLGQLQFQGRGTGFQFGADIRAVVTAGTPSSTDMQSRLEIRAAAAGSVSATEVARFETATGLSMFGANPVIDQNRLIRLRGYTVATLPAAGTAGRTAYVTDALAPAFLVAVAGGGAVVTTVFDNGAAWVAQ